jgi:hypothetical protein
MTSLKSVASEVYCKVIADARDFVLVHLINRVFAPHVLNSVAPTHDITQAELEPSMSVFTASIVQAKYSLP